jgi:hypothetical protein
MYERQLCLHQNTGAHDHVPDSISDFNNTRYNATHKELRIELNI